MRQAFPDGLRSRGAALTLLALVCALPFIGRSVSTADGAEVVSESLGLFVEGGFGYGRMPPPDGSAPDVAPAHHSKYGLFPSLLPLPGLGAGWSLRRVFGAAGIDVLTAFTWAAGALLAGLAFGRLVRVLRPDATGPWEAALVVGTFLWPYGAESFVEPFAAAGLATGAAFLLSDRSPSAAALPWAAACVLKPILWATTPVFALAIVLDARSRRGAAAGALRAVGVFVAALGLHAAANRLLYGSFFEAGYGAEMLRFSTPLGVGLFGLLLSPGRGLLLYAPVVLAGLAGLRRAPRAAVLVCFGAPFVHILVVARWWSWEGGTAWGPRHLLPVLPLLVAPAVLVAAEAVRALFVAGALVNLPGVLVASGSWDGYAESLRPPAGVVWPVAGPIRVATIPALSPILGHAWLAARNLAGLDPPRPWLRRGVTEDEPPPDAAASVSPWLLRRGLRLPPVPPMIPRLLVRSAAGYLARGEAARAAPWAREALRLSPADPDAARLLAYAEEQLRGPAKR